MSCAYTNYSLYSRFTTIFKIIPGSLHSQVYSKVFLVNYINDSINIFLRNASVLRLQCSLIVLSKSIITIVCKRKKPILILLLIIHNAHQIRCIKNEYTMINRGNPTKKRLGYQTSHLQYL